MKNYLLKILILFSVLFPYNSQGQPLKSKDEILIRKIMENQEASWNDADLEGFMKGYWESDSLVFVGKSGPTWSWEKTLENYKKGYPDKAAMGKLAFTLLHIKQLGKGHALVIGKWKLEREKDTLEGHFSLCWKKINGTWVIIADHSS